MYIHKQPVQSMTKETTLITLNTSKLLKMMKVTT